MTAHEPLLIDGDGAERVVDALERIEARVARRVWRWELAKITLNTLVVLAAGLLLWHAVEIQVHALNHRQDELWLYVDRVSGASASP